MAKRSLLEIVQEILSSLDGEEINSISDTVESIQIAYIVRSAYEEIKSSTNAPQQSGVVRLTNSTDVTLPVVMYIPSNVMNIDFVKYNKATVDNPTVNFQDVQFMENYDYMSWMFNQANYDGIQTGTLNNLTFFYRNDKSPDFYTVLQNNILLFDSYDQAMGDTLLSTSTACIGEYDQGWSMTDAFVPNLTVKEFNLLLNTAKAQAFVEQKQTANPTAEKRARTGLIRTQRDKISAPYGLNSNTKVTVNYGRKAPSGLPRYLRNGQ